MNGGLVPLTLLSVTIGLTLAFTPARMVMIGLIAFAVAALVGFDLPVGLSPTVTFIGLWLSMIATAILVYLPAGRWLIAALPLCLNAGFWLGACVGGSDDRTALALGLLPALIAIPAKWLTQRKFDIVFKVAASWMIAIASLSLFVSVIPTPGYKPDHME